MARFSMWSVALLGLVAIGCGSDPPEEETAPTIRMTTEALIEAEVTGPAALGALTPACPEINSETAAVGTTFQCTATTGDERVLTLLATIGEDGRVQVTTTNVITGPALPSFERAAVEALNTTVQSSLEESAIDCGEETVVLPLDQNGQALLVCALFDPVAEATYDVTLSISDIEARQFSLVVADQPRP
ncbi:MAG: hypothetical protein AAGA65_24220 [Actinomycetota bacterium]